MGQQVACTLRFQKKTLEGTAWLEHKDLLFRGPEQRLSIPLKEITSATAHTAPIWNGSATCRAG